MPHDAAVYASQRRLFEAGLADIDPEYDHDGPVIDVMRIPETGDPFEGFETRVFEVRIVDPDARRVRVTCSRAYSIIASNDLGDATRRTAFRHDGRLDAVPDRLG